jgi:hypothetical protein
MTRSNRPLAVLAAVAACAALAPAASAAAGPDATASKSCRVGDSRSYGTTYVLKISVSGTSCRAGRKVIRAFHACRPGKSGKCSGVLGYSCSERRFNKSRTSYDSNVSCRKGGKTVKHTYTQFI